MNKYLTICSLFFIPGLISAQDTGDIPFSPNGDPIIKIFANVHSGLTETDLSKAFEVRTGLSGL